MTPSELQELQELIVLLLALIESARRLPSGAARSAIVQEISRYRDRLNLIFAERAKKK
jgi:hypothetical protein